LAGWFEKPRVPDDPDGILRPPRDWVFFQNGRITSWAGGLKPRKPYFLSATGSDSIKLVVSTSPKVSGWRRVHLDNFTFGLAFYMRAMLSKTAKENSLRTDSGPDFTLVSVLQSIEIPTFGHATPVTIKTLHRLIETNTEKLIWEKDITVSKKVPSKIHPYRGAHAMSMCLAAIASQAVNELNVQISNVKR
jgi:hypothetical protein